MLHMEEVFFVQLDKNLDILSIQNQILNLQKCMTKLRLRDTP
jgi:hypothetical protein